MGGPRGGVRCKPRFPRPRLFLGGEGDRQVDVHRPGPALGRDRERPLDQGIERPVLGREGRLGDGGEHRPVIEDLMAVTHGLARVDAAGQIDQRHALLLGVGDDVDRVGHAGPERRQ